MRRAPRTALIVSVAVACLAPRAAQPGVETIQLVATHPLVVREPSDLAIDVASRTLWTVSNHPSRVYQLDLEGNLVKTLKYEGLDLEGVAFDPSSRTLWVAEERAREIVHLSLDGDVLGRHRLKLGGKPNSGPEGLCLDDHGRMFVVNEKEPGLFIELDRNLDIATMRPLAFAGDYSGITSSHREGCFWIVSDQSQTLTLWSKPKGVIAQFPLGFPKAEGVAVDEAARRVYVTSESGNMLYVFQLVALPRSTPAPAASVR